MQRDAFLAKARALRNEGKSIRGIAAELEVHPSRVQRALAAVTSETADRPRFPSGAVSLGLSAADTAFVGQRLEMGILEAAMEDARQGRGRLIMLAGDSGIGKTRISSELAALASSRRVGVFWGHCLEEIGAPP